MRAVVLDVAPQDLFECELGRDYSLPVEWIREGAILPPSGSGDPDSLRAIRPWVLEQADGTLRMWYSGHDGTTWRILEAVQREGRGWDRVGLAIDAGFAGDSDGYGVQSPCAVRTPGGYLMCYAGFDGEVTRLHMATSPDGRDWVPQGTFMQRGSEDGLGATHPCLVVTGERWWLFFSGYDGSRNGRRAVVLAAVSSSGASWDRIGTILEPAGGELATSHPFHRRAAHAGGGGRGRGRDRRGVDPQADAGPGRAPDHRRHHTRRVPQAPGEGLGPGAQVPTDLRGAADRRSHDRHPDGPSGSV